MVALMVRRFKKIGYGRVNKNKYFSKNKEQTAGGDRYTKK